MNNPVVVELQLHRTILESIEQLMLQQQTRLDDIDSNLQAIDDTLKNPPGRTYIQTTTRGNDRQTVNVNETPM